MTSSEIVAGAKDRMGKAEAHLQEELKKVRTGRAHPSMLDGLMVESYGTPMPLNQVASVSAPEAQQLQITPYDPSNLQAISSAIRDNQSLGMNPMDDGRVVRVPIPPLTEERRREYVKLVGSKVEDAMVALRNIRHEAIKAVDEAKKAKELGEDDAKRLEKQVDDIMNQAKATMEVAAKTKESEIMTV